MPYDFDRPVERRGTNSIKWKRYGPEVLPLWVADMDFPAPEPVQEALRRAVEHGVYGYELPSKELAATVAARMERLYGWQVSPAAVVATPGVVAGFNVAARSVCAPGEGVLIQPPVYPPFLTVQERTGLVRQMAQLACSIQGRVLHYEIDWDVFEASFDGGGRTGMFLFCNPHNPTGQVYAPADLLRIAEICARREVVICSDEIHSELLLDGVAHTPIAALAPEIAKRTITLVAPSKTFNVPGLFCGFAIIPDAALRRRYKKTIERMALHVNNLGQVAAQAAFSGACDDWLAELRRYLAANRDFLTGSLESEFNGIRFTIPQATYLAWLDCSDLVRSGAVDGAPSDFFLKKAKVALNDGREFGPGGEGFVRLNFGCPRATLAEALSRMRAALGP